MEFKNVQDFEVFFSKYDVTLAQQIKNENQNYEISDEDSFNSNKGFDFYQEIRALLNQDQKKSIRTRHISLHKIGEAVNKALACYPVSKFRIYIESSFLKESFGSLEILSDRLTGIFIV